MDSIRYIVVSVYFLIFFTTRTLQFNLETRLPVIKNGPPNSYFGFSVAEHIKDSYESIFLVGAPIFQDDTLPFNKTGGVFQCPLSSYFDDCTVVPLEIDENDPDQIKNGEWLGVTISSQGDRGKVVTCAHRYKEVVSPPGEPPGINPLGRCFLLEPDLTNQGGSPWIPCKGDGLGHEAFGYCQAGTGLSITTEQSDAEPYMVIGGPGAGHWRGSVMVTTPTYRGYDSTLSDESTGVGRNSYLGFSTTAGRFAEDKTFFVGGAPRAGGLGAVVIMNRTTPGATDISHIDVLYSTAAFSSFGYDVAAVDLNGDGFDDIIAGAPMFYDRETLAGGAIYIFINEAKDGTFSDVTPIIITGPRDSRFGMTVTNLGDLNFDGCEDLAVDAPYENDSQGAVYIYLGSRSDGIVQPHVQKITPSDFPSELHDAVLPNDTFGYSLAGGVDLDGNAVPDLLIGALDSESVVLLRGRPVINMTATVTVLPTQLDTGSSDCGPGCRTNFTIEVCARYFTDADFNEELEVLFEIEAETKRRSLGLNSRVYFDGADPDHILSNQSLLMAYKSDERLVCADPIPAFLREGFTDIYRSIPLRVTFSLPAKETSVPSPGEVLPSLDDYVIFDTSVVRTLATEKVEFRKECAIDDGECITDLVVDAEFRDLHEVSASGNPLMKVGIHTELKLAVTIENKEEQAYDANLMVEFSSHLKYAGLEEGATERVRYSCGDPVAKEDKNDTMMVTCVLGNPYPPVPAKDSMIMRFDADQVPPHTKTLEFLIRADKTNEDSSPEDNEKLLVLDVESVTDIQLDGASSQSQLFFGGIIRGESAISREEEIGPLMQHRWTVFNQGPARVQDLKVTIDFPYEVTNGKWLLYMVEAPMMEKGNGTCNIDDRYLNELNIKPCLTNCSEKVDRNQKAYDPSDYLSPDQVTSNENVVLDCENGTARCFQFTCIIHDLTAEQNENEAIILIKARLWNATFMEDYLPARKVTVRIHGYLEMANDSVTTQTNVNNDRDTINFDVVGPKLYVSDGGISWWIILIAILLGLFLLILLIVCLWKIGFFRRPSIGGSGGPFGFFERKTGYKYATVTQRNAETKVGTEKRQMYDDMYKYTPVPSENQPHQL